MLQVLGGLEQRGLERVVSGLGVQGRAMDQQRRLARVAGRLGVRAWAWHLQPHLDAEGRFGCPLVFKDHFGGGDRRQAMQVLQLFLHLTVPSGLGDEVEIASWYMCETCGELEYSISALGCCYSLDKPLKQQIADYREAEEYERKRLSAASEKAVEQTLQLLAPDDPPPQP